MLWVMGQGGHRVQVAMPTDGGLERDLAEAAG